MNEAVTIQNLSYAINDCTIISNIDICVKKHQWVGLIGPNGCGKSTLLKNVYRQYHPTEGAVIVDGNNIHGLRSKEAARRMAVLAQENNLEFDFAVKDVVATGRYAYISRLRGATERDEEVCLAALKTVGMEKFIDRSFLSLSGGEKQRVYVAMALAQQSHLIIMDEPTNHLDIGYQLLLMDTLERERKNSDLTIFTSLHDMDMAAAYCDQLIMMNAGKVIAIGTPDEVLTKERIAEVFNVDVELSHDITNGRLRVKYLRYINNSEHM